MHRIDLRSELRTDPRTSGTVAKRWGVETPSVDSKGLVERVVLIGQDGSGRWCPEGNYNWTARAFAKDEVSTRERVSVKTPALRGCGWIDDPWPNPSFLPETLPAGFVR